MPISIPLKLCLYLVSFLRCSASKNGVTLKLECMVVQGHWKFKVIENGAVRQIIFDFLLVGHCKHSSIQYRLWDIWRWIISWPWNLVPLKSLGAVYVMLYYVAQLPAYVYKATMHCRTMMILGRYTGRTPTVQVLAVGLLLDRSAQQHPLACCWLLQPLAECGIELHA